MLKRIGLICIIRQFLAASTIVLFWFWTSLCGRNVSLIIFSIKFDSLNMRSSAIDSRHFITALFPPRWRSKTGRFIPLWKEDGFRPEEDLSRFAGLWGAADIVTNYHLWCATESWYQTEVCRTKKRSETKPAVLGHDMSKPSRVLHTQSAAISFSTGVKIL